MTTPDGKLLSRLAATVDAVPGAREAILAAGETRTPHWFSKLPLTAAQAIVAWVAALLLLAGIFSVFDEFHVNNKALVGVGIGIVLLAAAVRLGRVNTTLCHQGAAAVATCGNLLFLDAADNGIGGCSFTLMALWGVQALVAGAMYPLLANGFYRFFSVFFLPAWAVMALFDWFTNGSVFPTPFLPPAVIDASMAGFIAGLLWFWRRRPFSRFWRPLQNALCWGITAAVAVLEIIRNCGFIFWRWDDAWAHYPWWLCGGVLAVGVMGLLREFPAAGTPSHDTQDKAGTPSLFRALGAGGLAGAVLLWGIGSLTGPGVPWGIFLMVAGYAYAAPWFTLTGYLVFAVSLVIYYYSLAMPLGAKGLILCGCGAGLLFACRWLRKRETL